MGDDRTIWYVSILANACSVALTTFFSVSYSNWKTKKGKDETNETLDWYDYIIILFLAIISSVIAYLIIFWIFGYVPMSQIANGINGRLQTHTWDINRVS